MRRIPTEVPVLWCDTPNDNASRSAAEERRANHPRNTVKAKQQRKQRERDSWTHLSSQEYISSESPQSVC